MRYVSTLLEGIKEASPSSLYFNPMFLMRRLLMVGCAVWLTGAASIQILLTVLATEAMMIFSLWVKPFEDKLESYLEVFNECVFMVVLYHHSTLLSWYFGDKATENLGLSLNITIGVLVLVHSSFLLGNAVQYIIKSARRFWKRRLSRHVRKCQKTKKSAKVEEKVEEAKPQVITTDQFVDDIIFKHGAPDTEAIVPQEI